MEMFVAGSAKPGDIVLVDWDEQNFTAERKQWGIFCVICHVKDGRLSRSLIKYSEYTVIDANMAMYELTFYEDWNAVILRREIPKCVE